MRLNPFPPHSSHCCPPSSSSSSSSSSSLYKVHLSLSFFPAANPTGSSRARWVRMDSTTPPPISAASRHIRRKEKLIVIMGATGTGKSGLSVDLATRFPSFEIINSDKMQVYRGLDITTNKIPFRDRAGVPHHLLGDNDPTRGELSPSDFRSIAGATVTDIISRGKLPVLVGGSNSFIHALVVDRFDRNSDVFDGSVSVSSELRYNCCFLWVDASMAVLSDYLSSRVDDMLDSGMFEELAEFYDPEEDHSDTGRTGLRKAIGVPEFDRYFKKYGPGGDWKGWEGERDRMRREAYEEAVRAIKENTRQLAKRQIGKILRLRGGGWDLHRVDATEAFRAVVTSSGGWSEIWDEHVLAPSVNIVKRFLEE